MGEPELLLASRKCGECLASPRRIVSAARAAQLIRECRREDRHFQCHKGSLAGVNLHCRGVHEIAPSRAFRFAQAMGIAIREIDPEGLGNAHG